MQIKQLEEGGESAFYTPEIKFTMGRKLIRSFGVDVVGIENMELPLVTDLSKVVSDCPAPQERNRVSINSKSLIFFAVGFAVLFYLLILKY
jgi:hypothetical protein